jgi:hypothetical protein
LSSRELLEKLATPRGEREREREREREEKGALAKKRERVEGEGEQRRLLSASWKRASSSLR